MDERQLLTLIRFVSEATVLEKINAGGIAFAVNEQVVQRLQAAGATPAIIQAVRNTASSQGASASGQAVTHQDVLDLLKAGLSGDRILTIVRQSPTRFVLSVGQEQQLRAAGASTTLISALKERRPTSGISKQPISDLAVILDCSGSMSESTSDGQTKMQVAKDEVSRLVEYLPESMRLTFIIYGHDKRLGCEAVQVVRPLTSINAAGKRELRSFIAGLRPAGKTPIALALETAGQQLARHDSHSGLVLISDGKETCGGDPKATASLLAGRHKISFGIHVIGFDVDADGQTQLRAVAQAGGGEYYNATNSAGLREAVANLRHRIEKTQPVIRPRPSAVSAITLSQLTLEGFPEIKEVYIADAGTKDPEPYYRFSKVARWISRKLGKPILVEPGKYDVHCLPVHGLRFLVLKDVEVQPLQSVKINFNRVASAIVVRDPRIEGADQPRRLFVVKAGAKNPEPYYRFWSVAVQQTDGYGKPMFVEAGQSYDVVIELPDGNTVTIARNIEAKPGGFTVLGGVSD